MKSCLVPTCLIASFAELLVVGAVVCSGAGMCIWYQWDISKAVSCSSPAHYDDLSILDNFDFVLYEESDTIVVTELSDGDEGPRFEAIEDVSDFSFSVDSFSTTWDDSLFCSFDVLSVGYLNGGSCVGVLDFNTVWLSFFV